MKIGDLVKHRSSRSGVELGTSAGIIVDMIEKKVWRTDRLGKKVDWSEVDAEPHAVVLFPHNDGTINIPTIELEVINESRGT